MLSRYLIRNWRKVLLGAWSSRLSILAGLLTGAEVALPLLDGLLPIPRGMFAALAALTSGGAFAARIVAQKGLDDDEDG